MATSRLTCVNLTRASILGPHDHRHSNHERSSAPHSRDVARQVSVFCRAQLVVAGLASAVPDGGGPSCGPLTMEGRRLPVRIYGSTQGRGITGLAEACQG